MTRLARRRSFQCLHRYAAEEWSDELNRQTFGLCFSPHGHGHNYELEAYFEGPIDPRTGMIANLRDIDQALEQALSPIDGKHLNFDVPEFTNRVPTTEALANVVLERLVQKVNLAGVRIVKIRLYEYEDLWVDVWPG